MFILKKGHQPGVYVPLRALFLVLDRILVILTGNDNIHKSLDELEIWPDPTTDHRASCR